MGWLSLLYIITGIFQSGGWPSNVAVMGVWFGKSTRGLVMGIWNTHTSVGNILGSLIATAMLGNAKTQYDYHQFDVDIPHTDKESIHTAKMTLKDAEDWCDASSKCVAFTATGYDGSSATWSFTNATASGKHVAGANCTATGPCTFQVIPTPLHVLGRISPISPPFFPVFCAFSPSRRRGSDEPQAGTQGRVTVAIRTPFLRSG